MYKNKFMARQIKKNELNRVSYLSVVNISLRQKTSACLFKAQKLSICKLKFRIVNY